MTTALLQTLTPLNNILVTEGVERMGNETEESKFNEWTLNLKQWTQTMNELKMKSYILR